MDYKNWPNSVKGIVAGGLSGLVEIWFSFPLEYVKTQLHLDAYNKVKLYDGAIDCIRKTIEARGIRGLYFGFPVSLFGHIPKSSARFGGFEYMRSYMVDEDGYLSNSGKIICGIGSGFFEAVLATTPMETIKVKFSNDRTRTNPKFKTFLHGIQMIIKRDGFTGLYQGLTPTLVKQCSNQAIRFPVVEILKEYYRGDDHTMYIPNTMVGLFGGIAGGASVLVNTPVDVVKSRMQSFKRYQYKSSLDCAVQMWKREGVSSFYSGLRPRLTRVCLDEGFTFMLYDWFMDVLTAND